MLRIELRLPSRRPFSRKGDSARCIWGHYIALRGRCADLGDFSPSQGVLGFSLHGTDRSSAFGPLVWAEGFHGLRLQGGCESRRRIRCSDGRRLSSRPSRSRRDRRSGTPPLRENPVHALGDFVLAESLAIIRFVERAFDGPKLRPAAFLEYSSLARSHGQPCKRATYDAAEFRDFTRNLLTYYNDIRKWTPERRRGSPRRVVCIR